MSASAAPPLRSRSPARRSRCRRRPRRESLRLAVGASWRLHCGSPIRPAASASVDEAQSCGASARPARSRSLPAARRRRPFGRGSPRTRRKRLFAYGGGQDVTADIVDVETACTTAARRSARAPRREEHADGPLTLQRRQSAMVEVRTIRIGGSDRRQAERWHKSLTLRAWRYLRVRCAQREPRRPPACEAS